MDVLPADFGEAFDAEFTSATKGMTALEIPLFKQLSTTLKALNGRFAVEEYHGGAHQVRFNGDGKPTRLHARCELSDLAIIVFSRSLPFVRLTYLQAKAERQPVDVNGPPVFWANLEQWYLLSKRPSINGVGDFNPPQDLLSSAELASVGSFLFFYRDGTRGYQSYYAAADYLAPVRLYPHKYGRLQVAGPPATRKVKGYDECAAAQGNKDFASALYCMRVGTPIPLAPSSAQGVTRNWFYAALRQLIANNAGRDAAPQLAGQLLQRLDPPGISQEGSSSFGASCVFVIRSDHDFWPC